LDGSGNFLFPDFHPAVDGMMAAVRLLEYMVSRSLPLSEVVRYLPPIHMARMTLPCPWEAKGKIMRLLNNQFKNQRVENIDGLKVHLSLEEWVYFTPDPDKPRFEIVAEAGSTVRAEDLVATYGAQIKASLAAPLS
jgi:mannose-1-phosphate guanylyltransferase/phosphomannomutase